MNELLFVARCAHCGEVLGAAPTENGDWREAEQWCFLAAAGHRREAHPELVATEVPAPA